MQIRPHVRQQAQICTHSIPGRVGWHGSAFQCLRRTVRERGVFKPGVTGQTERKKRRIRHHVARVGKRIVVQSNENKRQMVQPTTGGYPSCASLSPFHAHTLSPHMHIRISPHMHIRILFEPVPVDYGGIPCENRPCMDTQ